MKTLNISISDNEFNKYGFTDNQMTFDDLLKIVSLKTPQKQDELSESVSLDEFVVKAKDMLRKKFDERNKGS